MRSSWQVLDSREHTLFRLLPWLGPRIVGSCGRLYAEEEMNPIPYRMIVDPRKPSKKVKRTELQLSLKLLDFIQRYRILKIINMKVKLFGCLLG